MRSLRSQRGLTSKTDLLVQVGVKVDWEGDHLIMEDRQSPGSELEVRQWNELWRGSG